MPRPPLHIAWLGAGPVARESGGVPGVANELVRCLSERGHRIDCFMPGTGYKLPEWAEQCPTLQFVWGTQEWRWDRWYARTRIASFVSGLFSRALGSLRLRRKLSARHRRDPYDLIFQLSTIESFAVSPSLGRRVPLIVQPETHMAGELKFMLRERRLALRSMPLRTLLAAALVMSVRVPVQRLMIRRARLIVCISSVFRDHMVSDYGVDPADTVVIPNPVRLDRFSDADMSRAPGDPGRVLVLGRISARKGLDDVIEVARLLLERGAHAHVRVVGGPSLSSDYTKLMSDLPPANSEFVGRIPPTDVPAELAASDVLLQASKYEPFGLTVAEGLTAGAPVVATTEVGAIEGVDPSVARVTAPGDTEAMADAIERLLAELGRDPHALRSRARAEAERLFATERVCDQLEAEFERVTGGTGAG